MNNNDVVVTGIGMVTPFGVTAKESLTKWLSGESVCREKISDLSGTEYEGMTAAVLPRFSPVDRLHDTRMSKFMSDAATIGCIAAKEAMEDANALERFGSERIGLFSGTGLAAAQVKDAIRMVENSIDDNGMFSCRLLGKKGLGSCNPLLSFKILANIPPCIISIIEKIKGPNYIFGPWEGHTCAALQEAWLSVRSGEVDCALTGGADYASHPATAVYLRCAGILSDEDYPAAAAAYLCLERSETAFRDGRKTYSAIAGMEFGQTTGDIDDPLSLRMGRSFAAAPAVLAALSLMASADKISCCGTDGKRFSASFRVAE